MLRLDAIGYLGSDAVVRETNGKKVINFSVCHTEKFTDSNGVTNEKAHWVNCSKWVGGTESTAVAAYLKKGTQVFVSGKPEVDTYTKDGKTNANLTLQVSRVELLSSKKEEQKPEEQPVVNGAPAGDYNDSFGPSGEGDLPY